MEQKFPYLTAAQRSVIKNMTVSDIIQHIGAKDSVLIHKPFSLEEHNLVMSFLAMSKVKFFSSSELFSIDQLLTMIPCRTKTAVTNYISDFIYKNSTVFDPNDEEIVIREPSGDDVPRMVSPDDSDERLLSKFFAHSSVQPQSIRINSVHHIGESMFLFLIADVPPLIIDYDFHQRKNHTARFLQTENEELTVSDSCKFCTGEGEKWIAICMDQTIAFFDLEKPIRLRTNGSDILTYKSVVSKTGITSPIIELHGFGTSCNVAIISSTEVVVWNYDFEKERIFRYQLFTFSPLTIRWVSETCFMWLDKTDSSVDLMIGNSTESMLVRSFSLSAVVIPDKEIIVQDGSTLFRIDRNQQFTCAELPGPFIIREYAESSDHEIVVLLNPQQITVKKNRFPFSYDPVINLKKEVSSIRMIEGSQTFMFSATTKHRVVFYFSPDGYSTVASGKAPITYSFTEKTGKFVFTVRQLGQDAICSFIWLSRP